MCKDHLGNTFTSKKEMAKAYGLDARTLKHRLDGGWSLEDALTKPSGAGLSHSSRKDDDGLYSDGKGNRFNTIREMAEFHGFTESQFRHRLEKGLSFSEAIDYVGRKVKKGSKWKTGEWEDHLGNKYDSLNEMAEKYGLKSWMVKGRLRRGWSLERALTTIPEGKTDSVQVIDHYGNKYSSIREMADAYGMKYHTLQGRLKKGWSVKDALTIPPKESRIQEWYDHLGNKYDNRKLMCEAYGISSDTFKSRLERGWTIEKALTAPITQADDVIQGHRKPFSYNDNECADHKGIKYPNYAAMGRAYGINPSTLRSRLSKGWNIEDALTTAPDSSVQHTKKFACQDYEGNEYPSFSAMCKAYGKATRTVKDRLKKGADLKEALTAQYSAPIESCTDHLGNTFVSFTDMCKAYSKSPSTVKDRLKRGIELEKALTMEYIVADTGYERNQKTCADHLGNTFDDVNEMCRHYGISVNAYKARLRRGMDIETALTLRKESKEPAEEKRVTDHLGNKYANYEEMASAYGLAKQTVKNRIYSGMTLEAALTTPPKNPGNKLTPGKYIINGKEYSNAGQIEREFGIKRSTFSRRLQQGFSPEEAVQSDVIFHKPRNTKVIDHKGREFKNLIEACKFYNIPYGTVFARLKAGWTQEEALRIPGSVGRSIPTNKDPVFELDGQQYYHFECPLCKNVFLFTKTDMKKHFLTHAEENEANE